MEASSSPGKGTRELIPTPFAWGGGQLEVAIRAAVEKASSSSGEYRSSSSRMGARAWGGGSRYLIEKHVATLPRNLDKRSHPPS